MGTDTEISVTGGVAQIALDAGLAARLTLRGLKALDAALTQVEADALARVIVLRGKGAHFPSGITDPQGGGDDTANLLAELCLRIERCGKPVIAVLSGPVVGAGLELALAGHYRLAHSQTRLGFPNARIGLVPRAGATQRLPRLVGAAAALDLLVGGALRPATLDALRPMTDMLFDDSADDAITRFATDLLAQDASPRPTAARRIGFTDAAAYQTAIKHMRSQVDASRELAPKQILAAVEAAVLLPIDAGLAFEQAAAEDCADTEQSKALAHLFHAEQAVSAQTRRTDLPEIATIAVLGGSAGAAQIVLAALEAGVAVRWLIKDPAQQRDSIGFVHSTMQSAVETGQLDADRAKRSLAALRYGDTPEVIDGADIVLRATRGQRGVPVPAAMPVAHCLPGTDPRLALHFALPASQARGVEVILGPHGTESDRLAAVALARKLNKLAVVETTSGLSLHARLTQTLWRAADSLVDLGQSPFVIDAALRRWGMAQPPFEMADRVGFDMVAQYGRADGCQNWTSILMQDRRKGMQTGRGYYTHSPVTLPKPDPEALRLINDQRPEQAAMPDGLIVRRILGALANEGAKALRAGVVPRAGDIDVTSVFTQLVPNWRGGVMHAAGHGGLLKTTRAMGAVDHPDQDLWTPDPIFAELIKYGRSFDDL